MVCPAHLATILVRNLWTAFTVLFVSLGWCDFPSERCYCFTAWLTGQDLLAGVLKVSHQHHGFSSSWFFWSLCCQSFKILFHTQRIKCWRRSCFCCGKSVICIDHASILTRNFQIDANDKLWKIADIVQQKTAHSCGALTHPRALLQPATRKTCHSNVCLLQKNVSAQKLFSEFHSHFLLCSEQLTNLKLLLINDWRKNWTQCHDSQDFSPPWKHPKDNVSSFTASALTSTFLIENSDFSRKILQNLVVQNQHWICSHIIEILQTSLLLCIQKRFYKVMRHKLTLWGAKTMLKEISWARLTLADDLMTLWKVQFSAMENPRSSQLLVEICDENTAKWKCQCSHNHECKKMLHSHEKRKNWQQTKMWRQKKDTMQLWGSCMSLECCRSAVTAYKNRAWCVQRTFILVKHENGEMEQDWKCHGNHQSSGWRDVPWISLKISTHESTLTTEQRNEKQLCDW